MYPTILYGILLVTMSGFAQQKKGMTHASKFINNFSEYGMDIKAAGIATIPVATLSQDGKLYIEYAYDAETENRSGKMTLQFTTENRFEGVWETDADNGNSYSGTLYFRFPESGTAIGFYKFGNLDYKITIFRK